MSHKKTLQLRMEEAALLPPNDPKRRQVEQEIASAEEDTRREWLQLLSLHESFRLELLRVPLPPRWNERLLAIPEPASSERAMPAQTRKTWPAVFFAASLGVLLTCAAWWFRPPNDPLLRLAVLAMKDHESKPNLTVQTHRWEALQEQLAPTLPFPLEKPSLMQPLRLVGGRKCKLGQKYVLLSQWKDQKALYSLFHFRLRDFHISPQTRPTWITPGPSKKKEACKVLIWGHRNVGYAFVFQIFPTSLANFLP